jgi:hypothetical protein
VSAAFRDAYVAERALRMARQLLQHWAEEEVGGRRRR